MEAAKAVSDLVSYEIVRGVILVCGVLAFGACAEDDLEVTGEEGDGCSLESTESQCNEGLACEPLAEGEGGVCAAAVVVRGMVVDSGDDSPIEGALVLGRDDTGAPVTDVAETDADGNYELAVPVPRGPDGTPTEEASFTLAASADGYQAYPGGLRPAFPISASDVEEDPDSDAESGGVIENASTTIALIPHEAEDGVTLSGEVLADDAAGTLVVAEEIVDPAPWGIADASGKYTIFNVPSGSATVRGYRAGLVLEPASVDVGDSSIEDVDLTLSDSAGVAVSGTVQLVNAGGLSDTSIVLIPKSVFEMTFEYGPVPYGLRAPGPGEPVGDVSAWRIEGVPPGTYEIIAALENDDLVRDPDTSISGTDIVEIEVAGSDVDVGEGFKVTEALDVVSPGADEPEAISETPTFVFADDSSEDRYVVVVHNALGEEVWINEDVPGVSGSDTVSVDYEGPELEPGMYYRFMATSWKDSGNEPAPKARTEDLRGIFVWRPE